MSTVARLSILFTLSFLITSCMSTNRSSYDEGADPYASIGYESDALLGSVDLKSPTMVAEGSQEELEFDMNDDASESKVADNDMELSLDDEEDEVSVADVEEALEENEEVEIAEVELQEIVEPARAPASVVRLVPSGSTATIVYTPLWIKIPLGSCLEVVQNRNYENGACIKRRM